jgi:hypothetical protein
VGFGYTLMTEQAGPLRTTSFPFGAKPNVCRADLPSTVSGVWALT